MMNILQYRFFIVLFLCTSMCMLQSCFSEIDFEGSGSQLDNLVIQGKLIKGDPSTVSISVLSVSAYDGLDDPIPLSSANVSLIDEDLNSVELLSTEPGIFERTIPADFPEISISEGKAYQIRVATEAGQVYESTFQPLNPVPSPVSIDLTLIDREEINGTGNLVENTYLNFFINTPLVTNSDDGNSYLKWETEGCYRFIETTPASAPIPNPKTCYFKEVLDIDKIKVFNGLASSSTNLNNHAILELQRDHRFSRGYYLTVYQQSLSEAAYEYWEQVSQVVERTGSLFESKPGKVNGNISNVANPEEEVFGFFYVTVQDTIRLHINPEDVNFPDPYCPAEAGPEDGVADFCYDCLLWPRSTLEKPDYWIN